MGWSRARWGKSVSEEGRGWGLILGLLAAFGFACFLSYSAGVAAGNEATRQASTDHRRTIDAPPSPRAALCDKTFDQMRDILLEEDQRGADQEAAARDHFSQFDR